MDLSPLVAWTVPVAGLGISFALGLRRVGKGGKSSRLAALGIAIAVGFALMFVQVALHGICVESLRLCTNRGDGNMSYWFQSLFVFPLYWAIYLIGAQAKP